MIPFTHTILKVTYPSQFSRTTSTEIVCRFWVDKADRHAETHTYRPAIDLAFASIFRAVTDEGFPKGGDIDGILEKTIKSLHGNYPPGVLESLNKTLATLEAPQFLVVKEPGA
jgi:hypothetical protein